MISRIRLKKSKLNINCVQKLHQIFRNLLKSSGLACDFSFGYEEEEEEEEVEEEEREEEEEEEEEDILTFSAFLTFA